MLCLENVLKISLREVLKMSWRHLEDILKTSSKGLEDVLKTPWRGLEDVLKTSRRRLQNVLTTSWRRLEDIWPRQIYWSWPRRLEDILKTSSEDVRLRWTYSSWSRRLEDVFKTSSRRLHQDECLLGCNIKWQKSHAISLISHKNKEVETELG